MDFKQPGPSDLRSPEVFYMRFETHRKCTFQSWPSNEVEPDELARDGFYFSDRGDIVKCVFCSLKLWNWKGVISVSGRHRELSRNCDLVLGNYCGNVPVSSMNNIIKGLFGNIIIPKHAGSSRNDAITPRYESMGTRMATFQDWPRNKMPSPKKLSKAGFYSIGHGDQTLCYYCGGLIKSWQPTDDPWVLHARWYPECGFVRMVKGSAFVKSVVTPDAPITKGIKLFNPFKKVNPVKEVVERKLIIINKNQHNDPMTNPEPSGSSEIDGKPKETTHVLELCNKCMKRSREIVFLPCGHFVLCWQCGSSVSCCTVCGVPTEFCVRAYLG